MGGGREGDWEMGRRGMREKRRERQTEGEKSKPTERKHSFTQSFLVRSIHEMSKYEDIDLLQQKMVGLQVHIWSTTNRGDML